MLHVGSPTNTHGAYLANANRQGCPIFLPVSRKSSSDLELFKGVGGLEQDEVAGVVGMCARDWWIKGIFHAVASRAWGMPRFVKHMKAPETDICTVWPAWTGGEMRMSRLGSHLLVCFGRRNRDGGVIPRR